jgi:hypothetical protein
MLLSTRSHSHWRPATVTVDDQDGPQLVSSLEWSTMELCDFAIALSDLRPREFATVTGLAPVMELVVQGHVFAITGSEDAAGPCAFCAMRKGHFARARRALCSRMNNTRRQWRLVIDFTSQTELTGKSVVSIRTPSPTLVTMRGMAVNVDTIFKIVRAASVPARALFFTVHRSITRKATGAASREPCWCRASSLAT